MKKYPEYKVTKPKNGKGFYVRFKTDDNLWPLMGWGKTKEEALKTARITFDQTHRGAESFKEV